MLLDEFMYPKTPICWEIPTPAWHQKTPTKNIKHRCDWTMAAGVSLKKLGNQSGRALRCHTKLANGW